jgi:hypothetical protein
MEALLLAPLAPAKSVLLPATTAIKPHDEDYGEQ